MPDLSKGGGEGKKMKGRFGDGEENRTSRRGLLYFTLSEIEPRIWFMLTGCNFRCRGCFRPARDVNGTLLTAEETLKKAEHGCLGYYGKLPTEAMITGGEPTVDKEYLLNLIEGLKKKGFEEIVLMTNGYEIGKDGNENYASDLKEAGLTEAYVDIKAFSLIAYTNGTPGCLMNRY